MRYLPLLFIFTVNQAAFNFEKFITSAQASGISLSASSPSASPNGSATLEGSRLSVNLYETTVAPIPANRSNMVGISGRTALAAPLSQYQSVLQSAVTTNE